jgi:hypothetical protein
MGTTLLAVAVVSVPFLARLAVGFTRAEWKGMRGAIGPATIYLIASWVFIVLVSATYIIWQDHIRWRNEAGRLLKQNEQLTESIRSLQSGISINDEFANITNADQAFRFLMPQQKEGCLVRVTTPQENMKKVAQPLARIAGTFCRVDLLNPADATDEGYMQGAQDGAIVVHMAKDPMRDQGFITSLRNVFTVRRVYDLPAGSPPGLVWIQIGRGSPWRVNEAS